MIDLNITHVTNGIEIKTIDNGLLLRLSQIDSIYINNISLENDLLTIEIKKVNDEKEIKIRQKLQTKIEDEIIEFSDEKDRQIKRLLTSEIEMK